MNRYFIFDLDHTLFDTVGLRKDMIATFEACGLDEAAIVSSTSAFMKAHEGNYDMLWHAEDLMHEKKIASLEKIHAFLSSSFEKHLVTDAKEVLGEFRARGFRITLLTKGIERFQRTKLSQTGLAPFFDEIRVVPTSDGKIQELRRMAVPEGSYFVNDLISETEAVQNSFPNLHCILFSPFSPLDAGHLSLSSIATLSELKRIISQN